MSCLGVQVQPGCCDCVAGVDGSCPNLELTAATNCLGTTPKTVCDAVSATPAQLAKAKILFLGQNGGYTPIFGYAAGTQTNFKNWLTAGGRMWLDMNSCSETDAHITAANNFLGFLGSGIQFGRVGARFQCCNAFPPDCGAWTPRLQAQPIVTGLTGTIQYAAPGKVTGGTALALNQLESGSPYAPCNGASFSFLSAERIGNGIVFACATQTVMFNCMTAAPDASVANCEFLRRICKWSVADMLV